LVGHVGSKAYVQLAQKRPAGNAQLPLLLDLGFPKPLRFFHEQRKKASSIRFAELLALGLRRLSRH
jgi:hypothetical protein